ncbi:O-antigen ligase family protein [uncultured Bacteroides sp.]|uniref:O-antigen ligase family protein n=3 Tax=uncultured Bacteroides sp. TaxID=162156 RepID=UPI0025D34CAC|nr:O-antigen ligase family protein [uncultured Bacteroides sp.]
MKILEVRSRIYLACGLLLIGVLGVLSSVCAYTADIPAGEMSFQYLWAGKTNGLFAICGIVSVIIYPKAHLYLQQFVTWSLILWGCIEVFWGLGQLLGFLSSNHYLFSITGSFYNPGPYSGYLAMIFPIVLYEFLCVSDVVKNKSTSVVYYLLCVIMSLLICMLLIGMSRASWFAVLISCFFVCSIHYSYFNSLREKWYLYCKRMIVCVICIFIILSICCLGVYYLKKDSADGRLFIWKITSLAISKRPSGYGEDSFLKIYGETQEGYFKSGNYSKKEELVAGSPQYAFNEYLRIALEYGIFVLIICLLVLFYFLSEGLKRKYVGLCGAILSLMAFSLFSYPLSYPSIVVTAIVLLLTCVSEKSSIVFIVFCLFIGGIGICWDNEDTYMSDKKWYRYRKLGKLCGDEFVIPEYDKLYLKLKKSGTFLFEYGKCLSRLGNYDKSNEILKEAEKYNCDPMILNIIGKNYQKQANYVKAEEYFIRAVYRLPNRIYPYYLLAKLYAEPAFYSPEKYANMKKIVLTKRPKVYSIAIQEMRDDLNKNYFQ